MKCYTQVSIVSQCNLTSHIQRCPPLQVTWRPRYLAKSNVTMFTIGYPAIVICILQHLHVLWLYFNSVTSKANLEDLIGVAGLITWLKLDSNHRCFGLYALEIWSMTSKNNRAHLHCYVSLCVIFQSHWRIHTEVTVQKRPIWVKLGDIFVPCGIEIWQMALKKSRAPMLYQV